MDGAGGAKRREKAGRYMSWKVGEIHLIRREKNGCPEGVDVDSVRTAYVVACGGLYAQCTSTAYVTCTYSGGTL
jgi:hypothetical protein